MSLPVPVDELRAVVGVRSESGRHGQRGIRVLEAALTFEPCCGMD
jgi:hypothetical protein